MSAPLDEAPLVLISIVGMRCESFIVDCIRAVLAGSHGRFAIVVTENGGRDGFDRLEAAMLSASLVAGSPSISESGGRLFKVHVAKNGGQPIILCDPRGNLGYAGGTNVAIEQSLVPDWHFLWVLNPDTIPASDALQRLIEHQRAGGYGMVGSRLIFTATDKVQTWGGLGWNLWLGRGRYLGYMRSPDEQPDIADVERRTDFVSGASMYVSRRYVETVGPMDASYFMFCEDLDWCLRGRGAFRFGYAHGSVVRHVHGGAAGSSRIRKQRSLFSVYFGERNKVLVMRRFLGLGAPLAIVLALLGTSEYLLRARSWPQFRTALRGWAAGVRGETGPRGF